jgi:hypothetical protein
MRPLDMLQMTADQHISKQLPHPTFPTIFGFHAPFLRVKTFNLTCTTRYGSSLAALDCAFNALLFEHITKGATRIQPNGHKPCARPVI